MNTTNLPRRKWSIIIYESFYWGEYMETRKFYTLEECLAIGASASKYARAHIHKGSSQIENNALEPKYFWALAEGVNDVRPFIDQLISEKKKQSKTTNPDLLTYDTRIEISTKYSLGNCDELAVQALDYVLNQTDDLRAEVFKIQGGAHVFLVINRNNPSDPNDPYDWGKNAVICDPWANKVFKASDYKTELKNYYYLNQKNHIEDFNPDNHTLVPYHNIMNTDFLREAVKFEINQIKSDFRDKLIPIYDSLDSYQSSLSKVKSRLSQMQEPNAAQINILKYKIDQLSDVINTIKHEEGLIVQEKNYRIVKNNISIRFPKIANDAIFAMEFKPQELSVLFGIDTFDKKIMHFFGEKSEVHSEIEIATSKVNKSIGNWKK